MLLRISLAVGVITALLVAFLVVRTTDETEVSGTRTVAVVWEVGPDLDRGQAKELIASTARLLDMTLYRSVVSPGRDGPTRDLSVITLGADSTLPNAGEPYRDFSPSTHTRFAPRPADDSPGGTYVTGADSTTTERFAAELSSHGMRVTTRDFDAVGLVLWTAEITPLVPLILAAVLGLAFGCFVSIVDARRRDAIRRVNGYGRFRLCLEHVAASTVSGLAFGAAGIALSVPILFFYNGLALFGRFAAAGAVGVAAVVVIAAMTIALTCLLESRVRALPAINGLRPVRRLGLLGMASHGTALALTLVVFAFVATYGLDAAANRRDAPEWQDAAKYSSLTFRHSYSESDAVYRQALRVGSGALEERSALFVLRPIGETRGHGPEDGDALTVNRRYLTEQSVVDTKRRRVLPPSLNDEALTVLVPSDLMSESTAIVRQYRDWLRFESESPGGVSRPDDVTIAVRQIASGQSLFTYEVAEPRSRVTGGVVAVLPEKTRILSDDTIQAEMTHSGLLFGDHMALEKSLETTGLASSVEVDPVNQLAAVRLTEQERTARASFFACMVAAAILVMAAAVLATAIAERNRRGDFVRLVHGARRWFTIGVPVGIVAALGLTALGLATAAGVFVSAATLGAAAIGIAADILLVAALLIAARRRLHADTITNS